MYHAVQKSAQRIKNISRGYGLPEQRLEVMDYTDTTIAEDDPSVGVAFCA